MANREELEKLSSDELFALAKKREREEEVRKKEENRAELAALREERRKLISEHNRELAMIDTRILLLGGRSTGVRKSGTGRKGTSAAILSLLSSGQLDTKTIRKHLESQGISTGNLAQTMAYLKRTGRVVSVGRGIYQLS